MGERTKLGWGGTSDGVGTVVLPDAQTGHEPTNRTNWGRCGWMEVSGQGSFNILSQTHKVGHYESVEITMQITRPLIMEIP